MGTANPGGQIFRHVSLVVLIQQTGLLKLLCVCPHVEWSV